MCYSIIQSRIAEVRRQIAEIENAWISRAQKRWALDDKWAEIAALEEELDLLAKAQEQ